MPFASAKATNVCVIPSLVISVITETGSTRAPGESLIPRFSAFSGHEGGGARYGTHGFAHDSEFVSGAVHEMVPGRGRRSAPPSAPAPMSLPDGGSQQGLGGDNFLRSDGRHCPFGYCPSPWRNILLSLLASSQQPRRRRGRVGAQFRLGADMPSVDGCIQGAAARLVRGANNMICK